MQLREELQKRLTNLQENYHLNTQLAMPDEIDQAKVDVKKEVKMLQIHVINFGKLMRLLAQNNQHFGLLDMKE